MRDREIDRLLYKISMQIQKRRIDLGYTQEELAEILDVSVGTIKTIEQGTRNPSLPMLIRISDALDLKIQLIPL